MIYLLVVSISLAGDSIVPATKGAVATPASLAADRDFVARQKFLLTLPDPATATLKSAFIGFGAGHTYACQSKTGAAHAFGQVLALSAVGGLAYWGTQEPIKFENHGGPVLLGTAVTAYVVARIVDMASASASAKVTSRAVLEGEASCIR